MTQQRLNQRETIFPLSCRNRHCVERCQLHASGWHQVTRGANMSGEVRLLSVCVSLCRPVQDDILIILI